MHLTIDFYEAHWQDHCIVCQCYNKQVPIAQEGGYIEHRIPLTALEQYIADVYHYTGQYYDTNLEEYFDKEPWDSVLYDLELILNKMLAQNSKSEMPNSKTSGANSNIRIIRITASPEPLPDIPYIVKEMIA